MTLTVCEPGGWGGGGVGATQQSFIRGARGPTRSEPFFIPFLTLPAKVPLSMISTFYRQMEPLS